MALSVNSADLPASPKSQLGIGDLAGTFGFGTSGLMGLQVLVHSMVHSEAEALELLTWTHSGKFAHRTTGGQGPAAHGAGWLRGQPPARGRSRSTAASLTVSPLVVLSHMLSSASRWRESTVIIHSVVVTNPWSTLPVGDATWVGDSSGGDFMLKEPNNRTRGTLRSRPV